MGSQEWMGEVMSDFYGYENRQAWREAVDAKTANPSVGDPATFSIGSDSYAYEVVEVIYFKSGVKAGQPKAVVAVHDGREPEVFTKTKSGFQMRFGDHFSGKLSIGYANDYQDPSF